MVVFEIAFYTKGKSRQQNMQLLHRGRNLLLVSTKDKTSKMCICYTEVEVITKTTNA